MTESIRIPIEEQSQTAEARRIAREMARKTGFDENVAEQVAIVVTEAATNLLKHASGGEILIRIVADDSNVPASLELLALDKGPGMRNLEQCLRDGFSTGGSPGQGLGAIVRLSSAADFYSEAGRGAALLARWTPPQPKASVLNGNSAHSILHIGAVNVSKPGQEVCGDSWGVEQTAECSSIMVADGLGHGMEAKEASMEAVRMLRQNSGLAPGALVERAHQALRSSRGAAVAVARIDRAKGTVTFAGIGNIAGHIYAGARASQHLVSVNGTAGFQTQRIREFVYPWPDNGMLVMHSDGLATTTSLESHPGLALRDPTLIAGVLYRDFSRHNDDATAVVAKAA
jgi:anti-sigma regulatory factor (Ser/Thr protein kinase)